MSIWDELLAQQLKDKTATAPEYFLGEDFIVEFTKTASAMGCEGDEIVKHLLDLEENYKRSTDTN